MKIWIDADACPGMIKEVIFKAAIRLGIETILVANTPIRTPPHSTIKSIVVPKGMDVADEYIVEQISLDDLVITADIPLAALVVAKRAMALNPRGELYTEENVRERLSIRNFMTEVRDAGQITGGPRPLDLKDKKNFAASFDRILTKMVKSSLETENRTKS